MIKACFFGIKKWYYNAIYASIIVRLIGMPWDFALTWLTEVLSVFNWLSIAFI